MPPDKRQNHVKPTPHDRNSPEFDCFALVGQSLASTVGRGPAVAAGDADSVDCTGCFRPAALAAPLARQRHQALCCAIGGGLLS